MLQLDAGAHADLLPRISELSRAEVLGLGARDMLALMTEVVGFFAPNEADPSASRLQ